VISINLIRRGWPRIKRKGAATLLVWLLLSSVLSAGRDELLAPFHGGADFPIKEIWNYLEDITPEFEVSIDRDQHIDGSDSFHLRIVQGHVALYFDYREHIHASFDCLVRFWYKDSDTAWEFREVASDGSLILYMDAQSGPSEIWIDQYEIVEGEFATFSKTQNGTNLRDPDEIVYDPNTTPTVRLNLIPDENSAVLKNLVPQSWHNIPEVSYDRVSIDWRVGTPGHSSFQPFAQRLNRPGLTGEGFSLFSTNKTPDRPNPWKITNDYGLNDFNALFLDTSNRVKLPDDNILITFDEENSQGYLTYWTREWRNGSFLGEWRPIAVQVDRSPFIFNHPSTWGRSTESFLLVDDLQYRPSFPHQASIRVREPEWRQIDALHFPDNFMQTYDGIVWLSGDEDSILRLGSLDRFLLKSGVYTAHVEKQLGLLFGYWATDVERRWAFNSTSKRVLSTSRSYNFDTLLSESPDPYFTIYPTFYPKTSFPSFDSEYLEWATWGNEFRGDRFLWSEIEYSEAREGSTCLISPNAKPGYTFSHLLCRVQGPGVLNFWWKVDVESGAICALILDGETVSGLGSSLDWVEERIYIDDGEHSLFWLNRESPWIRPLKRAYVDSIKFYPGEGFPVNVRASGQGKVTLKPDKIQYDRGEKITAIIKADPGWRIRSINDNSVEKQSITKLISVDRPVRLNVQFEKKITLEPSGLAFISDSLYPWSLSENSETGKAVLSSGLSLSWDLSLLDLQLKGPGKLKFKLYFNPEGDSSSDGHMRLYQTYGSSDPRHKNKGRTRTLFEEELHSIVDWELFEYDIDSIGKHSLDFYTLNTWRHSVEAEIMQLGEFQWEAHWLSDFESLTNNSFWLRHSQFGTFFSGRDWIFHLQHGWAYIQAMEGDSCWIFDPQLGTWFWTDSEVSPAVYYPDRSVRWLLPLERNIEGRWFQDIRTKKILHESEI